MALHDAVLEELGLAPRWVRRGMGGADGAQQAGVQGDAPATVAAASTAARSSEAPATAAASETPLQRGELSQRQPAVEPAQRAEFDAAGSVTSDRTADVPAEDMSWFDESTAPPMDDASFPLADEASDAPVSARAQIATLGWDELASRVAGCHACGLCEKRTNTVFGVGDREAEWMLIGEAPGENEDRQGEPFVGQAGKLLDNMLKSLALARDDNVYIANVIKCRPPGNRNPEPEEVARCEPYLQRQVALVKPKLIVAMGRFAAQSLLHTDQSISALRGRVHEYESVPVIVTYHPAYLLRSLPDKAKAWADLCLARTTWQNAARGQDA